MTCDLQSFISFKKQRIFAFIIIDPIFTSHRRTIVNLTLKQKNSINDKANNKIVSLVFRNIGLIYQHSNVRLNHYLYVTLVFYFIALQR